MPDQFRRSMAPLTAAAWAEVDETAMQVLSQHLTARNLVDFDGPHGSACAAVNLGKIEISKADAPAGVSWGLRQVQPLIEAREPLTLDQLELDNISRGSADPDLGALEEAAEKFALFEETVIYQGFKAGKIEGLLPASAHKSISLPGKADGYPAVVADAVRAVESAGVSGPYALVLGPKAYFDLMQAGSGGYPPRRIVRELLAGGEILWSQAVEGGVLLSTRGGDFAMTVGDDVTIGYADHDKDRVELYLHESFTFRVLEPAAVIGLKPSK